jgi:hypothetical protein
MSECPYKNFKSKVVKFIDLLRLPRKEYGGLPPCPFVGYDIDNEKIMIDIFDPKKCSIIDMIDNFSKSNYESAVFVQIDKEGIPEAVTRKYQNFINAMMKDEGYDTLKCICVNPKDDLDIDGFNVRSHAPYFLITITDKSVLTHSHNKMLKSKYFNKMNKKYLDYLRVQEKDLNRRSNGKK